MREVDAFIQAEMRAGTPDNLFPYQMLRARRARRSQMLVLSGLSVVAVVAIVVGFASGLSLGGAPDELRVAAGAEPSAAPVAVFALVAEADHDAEAWAECLAKQGVRAGERYEAPPQRLATIEGRPEASAFADCMGGVAGVTSVRVDQDRPAPEPSEAFIARCLGGDLPAPVAQEYVDLDEREAVEKAQASEHRLRVIGVEGACLDRTSDYDPNRVNLILREGRVVQAFLF
jgi:hypothetical protein